MSERVPRGFRPEPFGYHQVIELEIGSLTNMGQGVGRIDGWVVMVPFALPGELVRASVYRNHPNFSEADLVEVVRASPHRVEPPCPLFGSCGGCQYQNFAYEEQLVWKRRQVQELLQRMAGITAEVEMPVASPKAYGYRTKLTPHHDRPREGKPLPIGFLKAGSRFDIVDVPRCLIATDAVNKGLAEVRALVKERIATIKNGATLLIREHAEGVTYDHREAIHERVEGLDLEFLAGDFFQNNPFILPELIRYVVDQVAGPRYLVDAYCGCGLFALAAAPKFESVAGVEISESSVARAAANAKRNGIANCEFVAADAGQIFGKIDFSGAETSVVIDPPRKGCDTEFMEQLFQFQPARVVYVSCNPATQMRDLKEFAGRGYLVERVQPFDLFPQTKHLECVVTLMR